MRDTPCAARGAEPLAFCSCRRGVAGRVDLPAEVGGGGPKGRRQGGKASLLPKLFAGRIFHVSIVCPCSAIGRYLWLSRPEGDATRGRPIFPIRQPLVIALLGRRMSLRRGPML